MRTAILISGNDALLALQPETDVERRIAALMVAGNSDVSVHSNTWAGTIGCVYRTFQGVGGISSSSRAR